jgi:hypothetical protein
LSKTCTQVRLSGPVFDDFLHANGATGANFCTLDACCSNSTLQRSAKNYAKITLCDPLLAAESDLHGKAEGRKSPPQTAFSALVFGNLLLILCLPDVIFLQWFLSSNYPVLSLKDAHDNAKLRRMSTGKMSMVSMS